MRSTVGAWQAAQDTTSWCRAALGSQFWCAPKAAAWQLTHVSYAVLGLTECDPWHPVHTGATGLPWRSRVAWRLPSCCLNASSWHWRHVSARSTEYWRTLLMSLAAPG